MRFIRRLRSWLYQLRRGQCRYYCARCDRWRKPKHMPFEATLTGHNECRSCRREREKCEHNIISLREPHK